MKCNEVVFILDRSGSMGGKEKDTIGGFNSILNEQIANKEDGELYISTVLFDDKMKVLHDRVEVSNVKEMTEKEYSVRGSTALLDAIGTSIDHIKNIHRYIRPEDVPEHTLFVIITDGMENASHLYSARDIKKMIEVEKNDYNWDFLFIGANIDAVTTAANYGIDSEHSFDYMCDEIGNRNVYSSVSTHISSTRKCAPCKKASTKMTMKSVVSDYKARGKK